MGDPAFFKLVSRNHKIAKDIERHVALLSEKAVYCLHCMWVHIDICHHLLAVQSSWLAPFTSEVVGSILATDLREKGESTISRKSHIFIQL